jgi:hypothetical protein
MSSKLQWVGGREQPTSINSLARDTRLKIVPITLDNNLTAGDNRFAGTGVK